MWIILGTFLLWIFAAIGFMTIIAIVCISIEEAGDISASWSRSRNVRRLRKDMDPRHSKHWKHYLQGRTAGMTITRGGIEGSRVQKAEGDAVQNLTRVEFDAYAAGRQAGVEQYNEQETLGRARTDYLSDLDAAQARYRKGLAELEEDFTRFDRDTEYRRS